ncbi:MAG TPA: ABC transporter ATP-binding protein [Chthoniobacteraceae bacterium]|jgi:ABC-2 type transport system ATP-binding protein
MSAAVEPVIRVEGLTKAFDNVHAVNGLSFQVMPGQVVGFIGANGAGKTTTMRILATLEMPDSGSVRVGGWDVVEHPHEVRKLVGWMPDAYGAYSHVTVADYLDFYARACGFRREERARRVREVMDFADLTPISDRPMNGLSKGMGQRLCFGRALLQDPKVLILDEPAAGLDPKARIEFKNLVQILSRKGATIFISSHILSELGEMCDSLLFIDQGRLVHQGTADALRSQHAAGDACLVDIQFDGPEAPLLEWLAMHPDWKLIQQSNGSLRAEFASTERRRLAEELRRMVLDGLVIIDFHRQDRRLEDVFVDVLKQSNAAAAVPPPLPVSPLS